MFDDLKKTIENFERKEITINDIKSVYYKYGKGPKLLIIPAFRSNVMRFAPIIEDLSQYFEVFLPELPGLGYQSKLPEKSYTIDMYAHFVYEFIKLIKLDDYMIFGMSLSGAIIIKLLMHYKINPVNIFIYEGIVSAKYFIKSPLRNIAKKVIEITYMNTKARKLAQNLIVNKLVTKLLFLLFPTKGADHNEAVEFQMELVKTMDPDALIDLSFELLNIDLELLPLESDINTVFIYTKSNGLFDTEKTVTCMQKFFQKNKLILIESEIHSPPGPTNQEFLESFFHPFKFELLKYSGNERKP